MKAKGEPGVLSEAELDLLQRNAFAYFLHETHAGSGLVRDSTHDGSPSSIAAVGLALTAYPVGVTRGLMDRDEAAARTLTTLRFLWNAEEGEERDATSHRGFFYHFLDMGSGRRAWDCELSTIDTAYLMAGALVAAAYFDGEEREERAIRETADALYRRCDFTWALNGGLLLSHGWKPEGGFLKRRWTGYSEALVLYLLALGSPTHPIPPKSYAAFTSSYLFRKLYGIEYLHAAPLFIHQLSHVWVDFRGIRDEPMRARGLDYFENSARATRVQRLYAIRNPKHFAGYGENCWGITASEGPGPATLEIGGVTRRFSRLRRARRPERPGRRHPRALGGRRVDPVRPRDRDAGDRPHARARRRAGTVRVRSHVQPDVSDRVEGPVRMGVSVQLRPQRRSDPPHGREPPERARLGPDAALPVPRARPEARGLPGRMAGEAGARRAARG